MLTIGNEEKVAVIAGQLSGSQGFFRTGHLGKNVVVELAHLGFQSFYTLNPFVYESQISCFSGQHYCSRHSEGYHTIVTTDEGRSRLYGSLRAEPLGPFEKANAKKCGHKQKKIW